MIIEHAGVAALDPVRRRIVVLGATGLTGRLVAQELAGHDGVLLSARRPEALRALGEATDLDTRPCTLGGLAGILVPGDVLLSCVGPYDVVGLDVVRTAVAAGVTYLDVSGEPRFLARLHADVDEPARTAGVTVLPSVGYEFLPGMALAEEVVGAVGPAAHRLEVAYLADGGLEAGSASGRRSLMRALTRPTTAYLERRHRSEPVAARRSTFSAGGRRHPTVSLGGLETWAMPRRHPQLADVDVHTGWFGPLGPAVTVATRVSGPARLLAVDRLLDQALGLLGDGPADGLGEGISRFVARVRDRRGTLLARREAVAGNPIVLAARLAAGCADALAEADMRDLPVGVTDPVTVFGADRLRSITQWAGLVSA